MYKRASEEPLHIQPRPAPTRNGGPANEDGPGIDTPGRPFPALAMAYLYRLVPIVTLVAVLLTSTSREILLA